MFLDGDCDGLAVLSRARCRVAARHVGQGTKGDLTARFVALRVRPTKSRGDRWLLCERGLTTDERKYYLLNLDATATLQDLVTLVRGHWPIEQQYRKLKDELGIDHFEGRRYRGWAHHTVLTAVAFKFLQLERRRAPDDIHPTLPVVRGRDHRYSGAMLSRLRELVLRDYLRAEQDPQNSAQCPSCALGLWPLASVEVNRRT